MGKIELDLEWIQLVKEALESGISKNEIREFLKTKKIPTSNEMSRNITKSLA
ncbi:anti-repressor SinI family protein [Bacillus sp. 2205SS5-2]|uniref:anti-repressor SinI family protein n=1 Tax=Bacillus sp. 2205SS5-2 TaxID=3109031 RepID=UPI0030067F75